MHCKLFAGSIVQTMEKMTNVHRGLTLKNQLQNQNRMCGKGVGLGLFPSDSLESQSYDSDKLHMLSPYRV